MNQLEAMRETVSVYREWSKHWTLDQPVTYEECSLAHMEDMLRRVEANPEKFSPAKLGRWLGWMQGAMTAVGALTLEQAKLT
jgi:hypothetical protein